MKNSQLKQLSGLCFFLGFASVAGSIAIWFLTGGTLPEAQAHAERFGLFVGLGLQHSSSCRIALTVIPKKRFNREIAAHHNQGGFRLTVELHAQLPGTGRDQAQRIMEAAHQTCPYSKALRGDAAVTLVAD